MVQLDAFVGYSLGATLALALGTREPVEPAVESRCLAGALLWLAAAFGPQTAYLLWRFPAWETMFAFSGGDAIPAWLVAIVMGGLSACGAAGFVASRWLVRRGRGRTAVLLTALGYLAALELVTLGWDGTGYRRMLYAGSGSDWERGVEYPLAAFLSTDVPPTLAVLVPLVMLPYVALLVRYRRWSQAT